MELKYKKIEILMLKNVEFYRDIVECLKQEGKCLHTTDLDSLWKYSEKKHAIITEIEETREKILDILSCIPVLHNMTVNTFSLAEIIRTAPVTIVHNFNKIQVSLTLLKEEIRQLSEENKDFIEEHLKVINDVIGIISGQEDENIVYKNNKHFQSDHPVNALLHREV